MLILFLVWRKRAVSAHLGDLLAQGRLKPGAGATALREGNRRAVTRSPKESAKGKRPPRRRPPEVAAAGSLGFSGVQTVRPSCRRRRRVRHRRGSAGRRHYSGAHGE